MTALVDSYMTFQIIDDRGVNLTDQIPIVEFEVEFDRDRMGEMFNVAPLQQMRTGRIYASFAGELNEVASQISSIADRSQRLALNRQAGQAVRNDRISVVANLDEGNWVQYKNAHLASYNWAFTTDGDAMTIHTSWMFSNAEGVATPPQELRRRVPRKVQNLDWRKLGF